MDVTPNTAPCQVCGLPLAIGQQGCIVTVRPHDEPALPYHPFIPYFDIALGEQVNSLSERWRLMKGTEDRETGERHGRLEYRDKMSRGDLSARLDRIHDETKRESSSRRG